MRSLLSLLVVIACVAPGVLAGAAEPTATAAARTMPLADLAQAASQAAAVATRGPVEALRAAADLREAQLDAASKILHKPLATGDAATLRADADLVDAALTLKTDTSPTNVARVLSLAGEPSAAARLPVYVRHADVGNAFDAFLAIHHRAPEPATRAKIAALSQPTAGALARIIDAQSYQQAALDARAGDVRALEQARAMIAADVLGAIGELGHANVVIDDCGLIQLDLQGVDNWWTCDSILSVDVGGFDTYDNNGGGAGGDAPETALFVHMGGNADFGGYSSPRVGGTFGGASGAAMGALFTSGTFNYLSSQVKGSTAGGADSSGVGLLVMLDGFNSLGAYSTNATGLVGGGATTGSGAAMMLGSDYSYYSASASQGYPYTEINPASAMGGGVDGTGFFLTRSSDDQYYFSHDMGTFAFTTGSAGGVGSAGRMIALGDRLHYIQDSGSDAAFEGSSLGGGVGMLVETGQFNLHETSMGYLHQIAQGAARGLPDEQGVLGYGVGVFYAGTGRSTFNLTGSGQGTGDLLSLGMMVSGPGSDRFNGYPQYYNAVSGCYDAGNGDCTYGCDARSFDDPRTCLQAIEQGTGRWLGVGIIADSAYYPFFHLNGTSEPVGQASALMGVGIIAHVTSVADQEFSTGLEVDADPGTVTGRHIGGGVGMVLDGQRIDYYENIPSFTCESTPVKGSTDAQSICAPEDSTKLHLFDPTSGQPLPEVSNPGPGCADEGIAIPCTVPDVPQWGIVSEAISEPTYTPTISGGAIVLVAPTIDCFSMQCNVALRPAALPHATSFQTQGVAANVVLTSGDDACEIACRAAIPRNAVT